MLVKVLCRSSEFSPFSFCSTCKQWQCVVEGQAPEAEDGRKGMGSLVEDMEEAAGTHRVALAAVVHLLEADIHSRGDWDPVRR
jgi:hypothetical protein